MARARDYSSEISYLRDQLPHWVDDPTIGREAQRYLDDLGSVWFNSASTPQDKRRRLQTIKRAEQLLESVVFLPDEESAS